MGARKPRPDARSLVMGPGRRIPRSPSVRPSRPEPPPVEGDAPLGVLKAAGELASLWVQVRACADCARTGADRVYGTGFPRASVMLIKEHASVVDVETGGAFTDEAEALSKAFDALGIPLSQIYGSVAERCSTHLLVEIETITPRVLVCFGVGAFKAVRALQGRCGLHFPDEAQRGEPVGVRSDVVLIVSEPMPDGVTQKESKRRLWHDLQKLPSLLGDPVGG